MSIVQNFRLNIKKLLPSSTSYLIVNAYIIAKAAIPRHVYFILYSKALEINGNINLNARKKIHQFVPTRFGGS